MLRTAVSSGDVSRVEALLKSLGKEAEKTLLAWREDTASPFDAAEGPRAEGEAASDCSNGCTVLHLAARAGRAQIVRLLVDAGGLNLVGATDQLGKTALHDAAISGQGAVAWMLVQVGGLGLLSAQDKSGETALHQASRAGQSSTWTL